MALQKQGGLVTYSSKSVGTRFLPHRMAKMRWGLSWTAVSSCTTDAFHIISVLVLKSVQGICLCRSSSLFSSTIHPVIWLKLYWTNSIKFNIDDLCNCVEWQNSWLTNCCTVWYVKVCKWVKRIKNFSGGIQVILSVTWDKKYLCQV